MQEFDPRHPPVRYAPRILICAAGLAALALSWRLTVKDPAASGEHAPGRSFLVAAISSPGWPERFVKVSCPT